MAEQAGGPGHADSRERAERSGAGSPDADLRRGRFGDVGRRVHCSSIVNGGGSLHRQHVPAASVWFPDEDRAEILAMIDEALRSGRLTLGPIGARLEVEFAERHQATEAVAVASGTSAIEIVLRAIGVEGREVVVPSNTFHATAAAVIAAGATPRFADCDPSTMSIDVESAARLVGPRTAAVIVVHIGGYVAPSVLDLVSICDAAGVPLVEDAAHAHGASLDGRCAGTFGVAGTFSFYPTKVIAGGEGGMIVSADERIADRGADLPRSGQGVVPDQPPHAARQQLADERAARRDRARPASPARRVHRQAPDDRRGL